MTMFGWSERPTKVEIRTRIGGPDPAAIIVVGQYEVRIPAPEDWDPEITYSIPRQHYFGTDSLKQELPNTTFKDGELRIALEDIISAVLNRVEPIEMAEVLWRDPTVREVFIDNMTSRWGGDIEDKDRRQALHKLQGAIHDKAVDRLADKMAGIEHRMGQRWFLWEQVARINTLLKSFDVRYSPGPGEEEGKLVQIEHQGPPEFKILGPAWNDARDYWRREVLQQFPMPPEPAPCEGWPADDPTLADALTF